MQTKSDSKIQYDFKAMRTKAQIIRQEIDAKIRELIAKRELVTRIEAGISEYETGGEKR